MFGPTSQCREESWNYWVGYQENSHSGQNQNRIEFTLSCPLNKQSSIYAHQLSPVAHPYINVEVSLLTIVLVSIQQVMGTRVDLHHAAAENRNFSGNFFHARFTKQVEWNQRIPKALYLGEII
eukprot:gene20998-21750_t